MQKKVKIKVREIKSKIKIREIKQEEKETLEEQVRNIPSIIHSSGEIIVPTLKMEHLPAQPAIRQEAQQAQIQEQGIVSYETRRADTSLERKYTSSERTIPILKRESQISSIRPASPLQQPQKEELETDKKYELIESHEKAKPKHKYPWEAR